MKKCHTCGVTKDLSEFTKRGVSREGQYQNDCDDCRRAVMSKQKRFTGNLVKRWKLTKGCQRCGFKAEHSCQLDLDHIIPRNEAKSQRQAINTSWSKARLKKELALCQVLCANCHRLKTFEDGTMFGGKLHKG